MSLAAEMLGGPRQPIPQGPPPQLSGQVTGKAAMNHPPPPQAGTQAPGTPALLCPQPWQSRETLRFPGQLPSQCSDCRGAVGLLCLNAPSFRDIFIRVPWPYWSQVSLLVSPPLCPLLPLRTNPSLPPRLHEALIDRVAGLTSPLPCPALPRPPALWLWPDPDSTHGMLWETLPRTASPEPWALVYTGMPLSTLAR